MSLKVVAILQARMNSSRLPGKVLLDIEGEAMLARVFQRSLQARSLTSVIVATTIDRSDDVLATYCEGRGFPVVRGSEFDVLDRYMQAARVVGAEIVVRITADCPLIDPTLVDEVVGTLLPASNAGRDEAPVPTAVFDFVANRLPPPWRRTYPIGLDVEACTIAALERAWREANEPQQREHVMPYLYEGVDLGAAATPVAIGQSPRGFRLAVRNLNQDLGAYRWTVDTAEDLDFVRHVYRRLGGRSDFSWNDVLALVQSDPQLMAVNAAVKHKSLRDVDERGPGPHPA